MKPRSSVLRHVYVLILKIVNFVVTAVAKYPQPFARVFSKTQVPHWCLSLVLLAAVSSDVVAQTYGTTLMIMRTNREIAVAADSHGVDANKRFVRNICKIRKFDQFFVVANGMYESGGFAAYGLLDEASTAPGDIFAKINQFELLARPKLELAFEGKSPDHQNFAVNFVGVLRGVPYIIGRSAVVTRSFGGFISVKFASYNCPGNVCGANGIATYFVPGESKSEFERIYPTYLRDNPVDTVQKFVQMNIDSKQPGIGGPMDVLRITKTGACWLLHKQESEGSDCETSIPMCAKPRPPKQSPPAKRRGRK